MLTDLAIRTVPAPTKGVKRYWDKDGLCLQVSQGGAKTFYFVHGADRRFLKLGRYPVISLSQARERVRSIVAKQTLGIEDETSKVTVQDAIDRYATTHCDVKNKPRTAQETKRLLTYLAPIARRPITAVKTGEVLNIVDNASQSMSERRHVFVASRGFFRWATRQRLIKSSPLQDLQPPGVVTQRDRLLTDEEMKRIYNAAVELGHPYGFICLIAIHTGMRRGEVGGLRVELHHVGDDHAAAVAHQEQARACLTEPHQRQPASDPESLRVPFSVIGRHTVLHMERRQGSAGCALRCRELRRSRFPTVSLDDDGEAESADRCHGSDPQSRERIALADPARL